MFGFVLVSWEKISLSSWIAFSWASPGASYGVSARLLSSALARDAAAWVALSCGEAKGAEQLWGKNSTVLAMRSEREEGM